MGLVTLDLVSTSICLSPPPCFAVIMPSLLHRVVGYLPLALWPCKWMSASTSRTRDFVWTGATASSTRAFPFQRFFAIQTCSAADVPQPLSHVLSPKSSHPQSSYLGYPHQHSHVLSHIPYMRSAVPAYPHQHRILFCNFPTLLVSGQAPAHWRPSTLPPAGACWAAGSSQSAPGKGLRIGKT